MRELTVVADRDRIAAELRDNVVQRIFTAGLRLQSAASQTSRGDVRGKIEASVDELDQTVRMLRDAIFGLEQRPTERGLRQEITDVCAQLSPAPEISFSGPVDALGADTRAQLVDMLTEALGPVRTNAVAARIGIAAEGESCRAVIEAGPGAAPGAAGPDGTGGPGGSAGRGFRPRPGPGRRGRDPRRRRGHPGRGPGCLADSARLARGRATVIGLPGRE